MEHSSLYDLIFFLEYGTKLHICVVFLDDHGNSMTALPREKVIHSKAYCSHMKSSLEGMDKCFRCRNFAIKKAINEKNPFSWLCFNGIYEHIHPIVDNDRVIAVIFIGNMLYKEESEMTEEQKIYIKDFERDFDKSKCNDLCRIIDNHIKLLIHEYHDNSSDTNPIVSNIRNFIDDSALHDITVCEIAELFNYNEKYIGKLFKKHTGKTIKEYLCHIRLQKAKELLNSTNMMITEISAQTGFNNVTYFNRMFKKCTGMSPGEYRKR